MKTYINYQSTNYNVNTEKRVVTCIMKASIGCSHNTYTAIGIAKCSDDDTFNERTGRRIAESRAKAKIYVEARRVYEKEAFHAHKALDFYNRLAKHCTVLQSREKEHIRKLSDNHGV